jgi:16S rRNA (uracil1498-N3)-methyltransferase
MPYNPPMKPYRFYVPDLPLDLSAELFHLPSIESHHAHKVLRLAPGDEIIAFNGRGGWCEALLVTIDKSGTLAAPTRIAVDPPPAPALTLATSVPKGERADWLVEQASQLNVSVIQWLDCQRSVVKPREGGQKIDKWRRLAIESAKQCGRTHLLQIEDLTPLDTLLQRPTPLLWLDPRPGGQSVAQILATLPADAPLTALIGPEGGWSDAELTLLQAADSGRLHRVRLTPTVLRIETACTALAAIVMSA